MLVSIQDLRSIQERCDVGELVQRLDVSIDRLTVIWDTDTGSLRRIFKNLKQAISTRVDSFEIHDNLWTYEIRNEGKTVAHNSGFKTKKLAESEAEPILQELRLGKRISRDISLVDLYQEWLELKILPSSRSEETKKKYLLRKNTIERLFGNKKVTQIRASEYQRIMNKYGQTVGRNFLGRLNTGIHQSIQMAIADKVLIDDFTQHVELFSSKEQQMTEEKYLHTEKDYLDLLLAVKRKFDYQRSIVPYIVYFLLKTGMRFGELIALT
ncbi:integrase/recombinase, phage associated protein [Streptococcus australis]|uniref:hypothetical protein n=1 Tax=Streptococcus australis TaxID=113107 RepID=UPI00021BC96B|nr:site-specific recombinase, phage integrase family [Streptococcus australis ATCC 700641]SQH65655.1 integrase/recombinase, phage associated protein [Streptococcus australis]